MPHKAGAAVVKAWILAALSLMLFAPWGVHAFFEMPHQLPFDEYGNILINRTSTKHDVKPATFSHWVHRRWHTCRVCHFELEFNMKVNTTEITEADNRAGRYCGASGCHDAKTVVGGKTVFGHEDKRDCDKCHNGKRGYGKEKFSSLADFPKAKYGNGIDWSEALSAHLITPVHYLTIKPPEDIVQDKRLTLEASWNMIPPAFYPHKLHSKWLDCNNCHPDIFNIKKKSTERFSMQRNLEGQYCGVCHMTVAFPMNDCKRCHPDKRS